MSGRRTRSLRRGRRLFSAAFVATALTLVAPAAAQAASAFVAQNCDDQQRCTSTAVFQADRNEDNHVTITEQPRDRFTFRDSQRRIANVGAGCQRRGEAVRCRPRELPGTDIVAPAVVRLSDEGDRAVSHARTVLRGGSGRDYLSPRAKVSSVALGESDADVISARDTRVGHTLNGGTGGDRIYGGVGPDRISGGPQNDRISGASGNDRISGNGGRDRIGGNFGNDRLRGGSGSDRVSGQSGNDRLAGQSGNDLLEGNSGNDTIGGGNGRDRLRGGDGRDGLVGNRGRDAYRGGPGRDGIRSVDNVRERVNCGTGLDFVLADRRPRDLLRGCNRVRRI